MSCWCKWRCVRKPLLGQTTPVAKESKSQRKLALYRMMKFCAMHLVSQTIPGMELLKTFALFALTALAEIAGCYLPYLWLKKGESAWLLVPSAASLALFAWLLTLHPTASGRVYAAYGGVYIGVAMVWLMVVDKVKPSMTDWVGVTVSLVGMAIIMLGRRAD